MDVEQRARELLADEFVRMGGLSGKYVEEVRKGIAGPWDRAAIGAIIATLWAISRACRAARNGLRWCWRRCAA
ncbi:TPA: hypothetical protein ACOEQH_000471 [Stenotrophomonas maltophilia]